MSNLIIVYTMGDRIEINVNEIIDKLLEVRGARPGKQVQLTEEEIKGLCQQAREVFMDQSILLELQAPIKICKFFVEVIL